MCAIFVVLYLISAIVSLQCSRFPQNIQKPGERTFPDYFIFGASTAAYQVEGAWNEDGRSPSIWDFATHRFTSPDRFADNGDEAADSYHHIERDVKMMKEVRLHGYRFSISWSRLLPTGLPNFVNEAAVKYYDKLINEMLNQNIEPFVTLYHYDLPQTLQEMGGFTNPSIITWFEDYARVAFKLFGDRVKHWITFNDPYTICMEGYGDDTFPPYMDKKGIAEYTCARNLLLSHANVWHMYDTDFRLHQKGFMSIALGSNWYEPFSNSIDDLEAANEAMEFELGLFANPIFSETGDYPNVIKEQIASKSAIQGYRRSRLPPFSPQEVEFVKGSADFFSLNHYSTKYAARNESIFSRYKPSYKNDFDIEYLMDARWQGSASDWIQVVPWGFFKILLRIKNQYTNPPLIITENGFSTKGGLIDQDRIEYIQEYLSAVLDALEEGVNVQGYFYWSLMDGFQWEAGYKERFGLFEVTLNHKQKKVRARKSALIYREIIASARIDRNYQADIVELRDEGLPLDAINFYH